MTYPECQTYIHGDITLHEARILKSYWHSEFIRWNTEEDKDNIKQAKDCYEYWDEQIQRYTT